MAAKWPDAVIEEFFAHPIRQPAEVQRLLASARRPCIVRDAHLMMLDLDEPQ
jgi:hypothetical protein